jgi:hypothetical protein
MVARQLKIAPKVGFAYGLGQTAAVSAEQEELISDRR